VFAPQAIQTNNELWLIEFYDPNCVPCQQLAPEFKAAAAELKRELWAWAPAMLHFVVWGNA